MPRLHPTHVSSRPTTPIPLATLAHLATPATQVIPATWPRCRHCRRCPAGYSSLNILLPLKLYPEGSSCLSFQPDPLSLLLILRIHPEGSSRFSFQPYHFIILLALKIQPVDSSGISFQPDHLLNLELYLQPKPLSILLLNLDLYLQPKHLASHETPSCFQLLGHLPSRNFNILLTLKLHPDGNSCLYFQPNHFRILLSSKLHPDDSSLFLTPA